MNPPRLSLRLVYRLLVTAISLPIIAAIVLVLRGETDATGRLLLVSVAALLAAVAIAVWFRHVVAVYVQIVALPILAAVYLFELGHTDPVDRMLHVEQLWRLVKARRAEGTPVTIQHSPTNYVQNNSSLMLADGSRVFPLAGVSDLPTLMCREGARPYAEYVADEHGFNNPQGLWGKPTDLVFIGDSMTYGACLQERDHFIAQIRDRYPATLNLSNGGIGPLVYLAIAREFLPAIGPKYVFYMYDENNDLYFVNVPGEGDLVGEYGHSILRQYLDNDSFSQGIVARRKEIQSALRQSVENKIVAALIARTWWRRIVNVLGLSVTRGGLRSPEGAPAGPLAPPRVQLLLPASLASNARPAPRNVWLDEDAPRPRAELQPVGFGQDDRSRWRSAQQAGAAAPPRAAAPDYLEVFKTVFAKTLHVANQAGAKLVFVNIPAQATVCDGVNHPWKKPVMDHVAQSGVDIIDLEKDFRNAMLRLGREQVFAVPPCGGHFSKLGYKVIGDRLLQYLGMKDVLSGGENRDGPAALAPGWGYRGRSNGIDKQPPWIAYRRTTLYDPIELATVWARTGDGPARDKGTLIIADKYTPRRSTGRVRITAKLTAQSATANEIVAALVVNGESGSGQLAASPVKAGSFDSVVVSYEREVSGAPLDIELRGGPGRTGTLNLNAGGMRAVLPSSTWLTIEELAFADQLVYSGTDLGEPELVKARHADAERFLQQQPNVLARALVGVADWMTARVATRRVARHQEAYSSDAIVQRMIKTDGSIVIDRDGEAIMGHSWRPKTAGNTVRVRVAVPAWSERRNAIVAALIVNGEPVPRLLASQRLRPRRAAAAILDLEIVTKDLEAIDVSVRVGVSRPDIIRLNSNTTPPIPYLAKPTLTIEEFAPFWR